jgi:capsular polysaccharide export protein
MKETGGHVLTGPIAPGTAPRRSFLLLQGPHGPFFAALADQLRAAGCGVLRIGFNRGDEAFWAGRPGYIPFTGTSDAWPAFLSAILSEHTVTDIALYGDSRPVHAEARRLAAERGVRVHVFEEGYLRPYWVTYERGGSNGNSRLMSMPVAAMRAALDRARIADQPEAPAVWGDMRQHIFYGALYHFFVMAMNGRYPNFRPHRTLDVRAEFRLHLRRLFLMPVHRIERAIATARVRSGGFPYHLALLQLEHDASFRDHSPFATMTEFVALVAEGFAEGAPAHHHLVFKAHPLEDGRAAIAATIRAEARRLGIASRVHFLRGGKLAPLLDRARSAVTVNSTSGQQALWRALPLRAFGRAVYDKPEFVSSQDIAAFFADPAPPDAAAYRAYRRYLLETSQVPGGFYSARGRARLLQRIVDMMLDPLDPYDALASRTAAARQHFRAAV